MRKVFGLIMAVMILVGTGCGLAETVQLPESRYAVTVPDGMDCDGPLEGMEEAFVYLSEELGLEVHFFRYEAGVMETVKELLTNGAEDMNMAPVNGLETFVFRCPDEGDGWKAIGYILEDGDATQVILFWYGTQEAADLTKTIMESIEETETI